MRLESWGKVSTWHEKHELSFDEEKKIVVAKVQRRQDDLIQFERVKIFPELQEPFGLLREQYADTVFVKIPWPDRLKMLREVADLIDGDDRKSFMMLYFYNIETAKYNNVNVIKAFGGSFGWSHYEWMMHWYQKAFGMMDKSGKWTFENTRLQSWIDKGRFVFE